MKDRNEAVEREVQRYNERKNIEHAVITCLRNICGRLNLAAQIALLNVLIPVERYRMLRVKFMEVKARQRKLHEKVKKLKAKNEPAHSLLKYRKLININVLRLTIYFLGNWMPIAKNMRRPVIKSRRPLQPSLPTW